MALWNFWQLKVAMVQRLPDEHLGRDVIVRKLRKLEYERRHDPFVDRDRWTRESHAIFRAI